jgi:acetyl esterase/lipase
MFGEKIENISYAENNKIKNSFGKGGKNYFEELGEVNNNEDYISNDRNFYDLYIPYSATQKKDQYNRIILFIHGGNWFKGNKVDMDIYCRTYGSLGFITATIGYTLLNDNYKNYSIFRIIDEITATTKDIKKKLIERGFDGEKLEMAISGYSAGGHLCLIYPYAF